MSCNKVKGSSCNFIKNVSVIGRKVQDLETNVLSKSGRAENGRARFDFFRAIR